jgi:hypothetical protein
LHVDDVLNKELASTARTLAACHHACASCPPFELQKYLPATLEAAIIVILKTISLLGDALRKIWPLKTRKILRVRENRLCEVKKSSKAFTKAATMRPWKLLATRRKREDQKASSRSREVVTSRKRGTSSYLVTTRMRIEFPRNINVSNSTRDQSGPQNG